MIGGAVGEVVSAVIPGQRIDRIASYLAKLAARVDTMDDELQRRILSDKSRVDLIEEGGFQAARALSDSRIDRIVDVVVRGLSAHDVDAVRRSRLLKLLGDLDDDEVMILNAYGRSMGRHDRNAWDLIDRPDSPQLGSSVAQLDDSALYEAGNAHLLRLGLLQRQYPGLKRGALPEFDPQTGDFKFQVSVSYLGRVFLREIGLAAPVDEHKLSRKPPSSSKP